MHGEIGLTNIALVILAALLFGLGMTRLKQPPILGYILAGIMLGPSGLAFVESRDQVSMLAEMGVLLLLFVIGSELNLRTFKKVWLITSLATIMQIVVCTAVTWTLSYFLGWSCGLPILLGFITAISSTAVAVKMLESIKEVNTEAGQLSIGILIAQDFAIVPMILILRNFHSDFSAFWLIIKLLAAVGIIVCLILYLSRRQRLRIPFVDDIAQQKDLLPLISLTFCFAAAAVSGFIGLSAAYGAFLAGITIGNSHQRALVLDAVKPIQSTLIMVFFLMVGILMDLGFIYTHLATFLLLLLLITVGKTAINIIILRFLQVPWPDAFLVGVVLAQLGEFAFLMASIGYESKIINEFGEKLILSLTALSLLFSPLWMTIARKLKTITDSSEITLSNIFDWVSMPGNRLFKNLWKKTTRQWEEEEQNLHYKKKDDNASS